MTAAPWRVGGFPRRVPTGRGCPARTSPITLHLHGGVANMNTISKWVVRTATLWAISKALQLANDRLRQRQRARRSRAATTVHSTPDSLPLWFARGTARACLGVAPRRCGTRGAFRGVGAGPRLSPRPALRHRHSPKLGVE